MGALSSMVSGPARCRVLLAALLFAGCNSAPDNVPDDEPGVSAIQPDKDPVVRMAAKRTCVLMEEYHVTHTAVDDLAAEKTLDIFLKDLDGKKLYFTAEDVSGWKDRSHEIDDRICGGDVALASEIYQRLVTRFEERLAGMRELIKQDYDFNVESVVPTDGAALEFLSDGEALQARWAARLKYELATRLARNYQRIDAELEIVRNYQNILDRLRGVPRETIIEEYLASLTHSYDPHSTFMSSKTAQGFRMHVEAKIEGIGISFDTADDAIVVKEIVPGGAVEQEGSIKPGDKILAVAEGHDGEFVSIAGMGAQDIASKIRGKAGTTLRLKVKKAAEPPVEVEVTLVRSQIQASAVRALTQTVELGGLQIAVLTIPGFYQDLTKDVRKQLTALDGKIDGLVVDLRNNGGGLLSEAIALTGLFTNAGVMVMTKGAGDYVRKLFSEKEEKLFFKKPLVIVVNRHSASASEIFAGALQDYGRAAVVGDSATHGKGTVQGMYALEEDYEGLKSAFDTKVGMVKITIQQFFRPGGDSTQLRGVESDIVLPASSDTDRYAETRYHNALDFSAVEPASFYHFGMVNEKIFEELRTASAARRESSEAFRNLEILRELAQERADESELVFSLPQLVEELSSSPKEDKNNAKIFGDVPYEEEVLQISADYFSMFAGS